MRTARTKVLGLAVACALAAPLFAAAPAPADFSCSLAQGYKWCDVHWPSDDLPVAVYVNTANRPSGISAGALQSAVAGAVDAWERAASALPPSLGGDCPLGTRVLCYKGVTPLGKAVDGVTVVLFGPLVDSEAIGETRWCFTGSGCPSTGTTLKDADVILRNVGMPAPWRQASGVDLVLGEMGGPFGPFCHAAMCGNWFDLQSVITHELGHVLGLDETEGFFSGCDAIGGWAGDPSDGVNFLQTMYPCQWKGQTNRRTPDVGDILGLTAVWIGSQADQ